VLKIIIQVIAYQELTIIISIKNFR